MSKQGVLRSMPFKDEFPGREDIQHYPRKEDRGVDACLFREILQNSRDAGARRVDFTVTETESHTILSATDNGSGMNYETIESGLVTFAGSVKKGNAAGGFGMAKNIIVYSPDETRIVTTTTDISTELRTHEYVIKGVNGVLQVTPEEGEVREGSTPGTTFTLHCPKSESPSRRLEPTADGLRFLLARCDLKGMEVYLNGEHIPDAPIHKTDATLIRTFKTFKGEAHYWKKEPTFIGQEGKPVGVLTHRGIWVCDFKVNDDHQGKLLIDVDDEPKKVLNPSRITLAYYNQQQELGKFTNSLAAGSHSVLKPTKMFTRRYDGALTILTDATEAAKATVDQMLGLTEPTPGAKGKKVFGNVVMDDADKFISELARRMAVVTASSAAGATMPLQVADAERLAVTGEPLTTDQAVTSLKTLAWTPALMVHNELEWDVDESFTPEGMSSRVRKLLAVWNEMVRQLLIFRRKFIPYGVGFIFSEDTPAQYRREPDGTTWFLLNPLTADRKMRYRISNEHSRNKVITYACHEVAHACDWGDYHSDSFVTNYDQNVNIVLDNHALFNRIWRQVK